MASFCAADVINVPSFTFNVLPEPTVTSPVKSPENLVDVNVLVEASYVRSAFVYTASWLVAVAASDTVTYVVVSEVLSTFTAAVACCDTAIAAKQVSVT